MTVLRFTWLATVLTFVGQGRAADLPSPDRPMESVIDELVAAKLTTDGISPAAPADDATFLRRVTLDLVGRIPTPSEVETYTRSSDADKRLKLIDRLLASPGYARYQAALFDIMLNDRPGSGGKNGSLRDYLVRAVQENRSWDRVFRELMLPNETDSAQKGSAEFLRPRLNDADRLTVDVSVAFFGVNVSCAQCHDHPHVKDWTQDLFYGMKCFLARTYDAGGFVSEKEAGLVKYKPTKGPERQAKLVFLTGAEVATDTVRDQTKEEQKKEKEAVEKAKSAKTAPPAPAFSARAKLVETALKPENAEYFSRAIVNRLWHRFLGYGLVNPLDQMHAENPPSHPELLAWLARNVSTHGYDLRRLVRGIVLSQAYGRASTYPSEAQPGPQEFAVARLRPLTPIQLANSLKIATTDPQTFDKLKPDEFEKKIEQLENAARGFAGQIAKPAEGSQIGVGEALLFSNGDKVMAEFLANGPGTLLGRAGDNREPAEVVKALVQAALGREARADEVTVLTEYVTARADRKAEAYRQVLWALLTGPEFRFNH